MAKECQNPRVPQGGGLQTLVPPMQGLTAYAQNFVPMQYPVSIPVSSIEAGPSEWTE